MVLSFKRVSISRRDALPAPVTPTLPMLASRVDYHKSVCSTPRIFPMPSVPLLTTG
jgi:hypothetical protein